mgnify:CR=1 FL=1
MIDILAFELNRKLNPAVSSDSLLCPWWLNPKPIIAVRFKWIRTLK